MGPRFRGDDPRRIHWVRFAKNDVGFVSPKGTSLSYPGRSAARKMASDAFVACRDTCWLVRSLYFPVFLQIRNLPSPVSRSHTPTHLLVPAAHSCARFFSTLLHSPRIEGWAERRETFGCVRGTRGRALGASQDARERAYDAGRSPLGAPPWRLSPPLIPAQAGIQNLGPRFRGDERKRLTPLPAPPSGSSPETPLDERGCERSSTNALRSQ